LGVIEAGGMSSAGALLERLAEETWDRLDLSHRLKCPQSEETFTDTNLLELVRCRPSGLRVYKASGRDEPDKGFDWEWYIGVTGPGWLRYSVQAKKLNVALNRYAGFRHSVGGRFQIDILSDFARSNRTPPLYCFYNAMPTAVEQAHWHCNLPFKAKQLGCSIAPLHVAQRLHRPRVRRSFEAVHKDPLVLPWRCIVSCPLVHMVCPAGHHPLAADGWEIQPLRELPAFLRDQPEGAQTVDLPDEGYASELGGFPRWIMVMDLRAGRDLQ
jgi:hypothetical protein